MPNCTPSSPSTFFALTPTFLTARPPSHRGGDLTADARATRCRIALAVYVALQVARVVLGIALSHEPAATSGNVMALADAPKLPIDITEAF